MKIKDKILKNILALAVVLCIPATSMAGNYLYIGPGGAPIHSVLVPSTGSGNGATIATPVTVDPATGNISTPGTISGAGVTYNSLIVSNSVASGTVPIVLFNTNNAVTANANLQIKTTSNGGGTAGGTPSLSFVQDGLQIWNMGLWANGSGGDNAFHISPGNFDAADPLILTGSGTQVTMRGGATLVTGSFTVPAGAITAGTGLTVTTGNLQVSAGSLGVNTNIATTTGNFVNSLSGTGRITVPVTPVAGASPITANGRIVQVTFTGVSIAAGATQAFTLSDSSISGASTVVQASWSGATTSSALSLQSAIPSTGQEVFTFTNGTGAATSTANITITAEVLN